MSVWSIMDVDPSKGSRRDCTLTCVLKALVSIPTIGEKTAGRLITHLARKC